jgi:hypothetical protein
MTVSNRVPLVRMLALTAVIRTADGAAFRPAGVRALTTTVRNQTGATIGTVPQERRTMKMRILFCLTLTAMGLCRATQAQPAVPLAKNGQPLAVIVHQGHAAAAPNLAANHVWQGHSIPSAPT